jgi:hypothetical protein
MKTFEDPMYDDDGVMVDEDGPMLEDEVMDLVSLYGTDREAIQMISDQLGVSITEVEDVIISLGLSIVEDDDEPYEPDYDDYDYSGA